MPEAKNTMQLLHKALALEPNASLWARELGLSRTAITAARLRGRLSPTVAGNLARMLGEDEERWLAIAALEAEPDSYAKRKILSRMDTWRKALNS